MAKWVKDGVFFSPNFKMVCLGCGDPAASFEETQYHIMHFPIHMDNLEEYSSYAMDRTFACKLCGWRIIYGIALSKKHFDEIRDYLDTKDMKKDVQRTVPYQKLKPASYSGRNFG